MNALNADEIIRYSCSNQYTVLCKSSAVSTNTELMNMAKNGAVDCTVLVAEHQTGGRGRLDRSFFSPRGSGVYFSVLIRKNITAKNAVSLTTDAAVAVALALEEISGKSVDIKWVNDIYLNNRKICGILAESSVNPQTNAVDFAVIGVGINILPPKNCFPDDIKCIAGYLTDTTTDDDILNRAVGRVLYHLNRVIDGFSKDTVLSEYRNRLIYKGERVNVFCNNITYPATVLDIDNDFRLIVKLDNGEIVHLSTGEVSVKANK